MFQTAVSGGNGNFWSKKLYKMAYVPKSFLKKGWNIPVDANSITLTFYQPENCQNATFGLFSVHVQKLTSCLIWISKFNIIQVYGHKPDRKLLPQFCRSNLNQTFNTNYA